MQGEQQLTIRQNYAQWMKDNDLLDGEFIAEDTFINEFLPKYEGVTIYPRCPITSTNQKTTDSLSNPLSTGV